MSETKGKRSDEVSFKRICAQIVWELAIIFKENEIRDFWLCYVACIYRRHQLVQARPSPCDD